MYLVAALKKHKIIMLLLRLTVAELDEAKQYFGFGGTKLYNARVVCF